MKKLLSSLLSLVLILCLLVSLYVPAAADDITRVTSITPDTLVLRVGDTLQLSALTNSPGYTDIDWWVLDNTIVSLGRLDGYNYFYPYTPDYNGYYTDSRGREYYYNENGQKSYVTDYDGTHIYYGGFDPNVNYYFNTSSDGWYYVDSNGYSTYMGMSIPFDINRFTYYQGRYYANDYFNSESPYYYNDYYWDHYYYDDYYYDHYYWNHDYYSLANSALYRRGSASVTIQANQVGTTEITAFVNGTQSVSCTVKVVDYDASIENGYYVVNVSTDGNGVLSPSGRVAVVENTYQNFTIIPNSGYVVDQVLLDYRQELTTSNNQFQLFVDAPYSIYVTFKRSTESTSSQTTPSDPERLDPPTTTTPTTPPTQNPATGDHIADGFLLVLMLLLASTMVTGGTLAVQRVKSKRKN